jgi:hypothetical protein
MQTLLVLTLTGTILSSMAFAGDFEISLESKDIKAQGSPIVQKILVSGEKIAMDSYSEGQLSSMIFRGDKQLVWALNHQNKVYSEITKASMEQLGQTMNSAMAQMKAQMANMPAEQRTMMETMMKSTMGSATSSAEPIVYKQTSEKKTISGYPCTKYEVIQGNAIVQTLWVSEWKNMQNLTEMNKAFESMGEFFKSMTNAFKDNPFYKSIDNPYSHSKEINGFPVMTVDMENGKPVRETTLKKVEKKSFTDASFTPPKNYTLSKQGND